MEPKYPNQLQESVIHYAKKTAEGLGWCRLLGSGSATHQAGYQFRFLSGFDTRESVQRELRSGTKTRHDASGRLSNRSDYIVVGRPLPKLLRILSCSLSCYQG